LSRHGRDKSQASGLAGPGSARRATGAGGVRGDGVIGGGEPRHGGGHRRRPDRQAPHAPSPADDATAGRGLLAGNYRPGDQAGPRPGTAGPVTRAEDARPGSALRRPAGRARRGRGFTGPGSSGPGNTAPGSITRRRPAGGQAGQGRAARRRGPRSTAPGISPRGARPGDWLAICRARLRQDDLREYARRWLTVSAASMALFVIRFLVPSPVGMADQGDGARLMCAFGVAPATGAYPRYDSFAFFTFSPAAGCSQTILYDSSQHVLLDVAGWLTPLLGLSGKISLIALGLLICALQSAGIASAACGLKLRMRGTVLLALALWLVMADSAFFDAYASPYSEGATLTGLLLVAAGVLYLRRGALGQAFGLLLAGTGGYLAILSKEQYLTLAIPVCVTIMLASAAGPRRGLRRCATRPAGAAAAVTVLLLVATGFAVHEDVASPSTVALHQEQVVDVIFDDIVNGHDNARADLAALGLPASWAGYAGDSYWAAHTVAHDPLYPRYASRLTDANLARYYLTHPVRTMEIGQFAANYALALRVNYLGSYSPAAGHPPGALEHRVPVLDAVVDAIPGGVGLFWLLPLWAAMAALAWCSLRTSRQSMPGQRDAARAVLLLVGCSVAAFIPAAFFAGVETTRHMLGMNLATALACVLSSLLVGSTIRRGIADAARQSPELATPAATQVIEASVVEVQIVGHRDAGRAAGVAVLEGVPRAMLPSQPGGRELDGDAFYPR
jgi:hypothetical protein